MKETTPKVERLLTKDISGAISADEHYKETGHKIKELGKVAKMYGNKVEKINYIKRYECQECDFFSNGFSIYELI